MNVEVIKDTAIEVTDSLFEKKIHQDFSTKHGLPDSPLKK